MVERNMNDAALDISSRLDALESSVAHQEKMLGDLNEVVTLQWRKIDVLEKLVAQLREEVRNIAPQREVPEPPPPHY
ncbi:MAG: SlyX family protein [Methylocystis sp.]